MANVLRLIPVILFIPLMFLNGCAPTKGIFDKTGTLAVEPGKCVGNDRVVTYTVENTTPDNNFRLGKNILLNPFLIFFTYDVSGKKVDTKTVKLKALTGTRSYSNKGVLSCSIKKIKVTGFTRGSGGYSPVIWGINRVVYPIK